MEKFRLIYHSLADKHKVELLLLATALIFALFSLFSLTTMLKSIPTETLGAGETGNKEQANEGRITVDIQGAVKKPDAYTLDSGARLKDVLTMAEGLTEEADVRYFSRQFNLAQKLSDEQKLYIPTKKDVLNGFTALDSELAYSNSPSEVDSDKINVNTASFNELDSLPGIGTVTAEKIISGRPYKDVDELLSKSAVNASTFDKIKDLVTTI